MPLGDVGLREFAGVVLDKIQDDVQYLYEHGKVIEHTDDPDELRRGMSLATRAFRVSYGPDAIMPEPGFSRVILYRFTLYVTLLYRKMGNSEARLVDEVDLDVTKVAKDVIGALQGDRLDLFNQGGVVCGPATFLGDPGDAIQVMRLSVTGRSRENRS